MESPEISAETAERRREDRLSADGPVRMRVETAALDGESENVSAAGILFFSDEPLRVSVELTVDGAPRRVQGRLVRAQRMSEESTGYAVEFDAE